MPNGGPTVIFIHGILSDSDSAWRSSVGTYWPQLLSDEGSTAACGIYLFSYRADFFAGTYSLGDAVDALTEHFLLDNVLDQKHLIFVCHSMGGIVARHFIVSRQAELIRRGIEISLFLVASPSLGSEYANFISKAGLVENVQVDALRFDQSNVWLNDLDKNFINLKESGALQINGKEIIEDVFLAAAPIVKSLFRRSQIVKPWSGAKYFGESIKIAYADHSTIAKPISNRALQHRSLVRFIREQSPNLPTTQAAPTLISITPPKRELLEKPAPNADTSTKHAHFRRKPNHRSNDEHIYLAYCLAAPIIIAIIPTINVIYDFFRLGGAEPPSFLGAFFPTRGVFPLYVHVWAYVCLASANLFWVLRDQAKPIQRAIVAFSIGASCYGLVHIFMSEITWKMPSAVESGLDTLRSQREEHEKEIKRLEGLLAANPNSSYVWDIEEKKASLSITERRIQIYGSLRYIVFVAKLVFLYIGLNILTIFAVATFSRSLLSSANFVRTHMRKLVFLGVLMSLACFVAFAGLLTLLDYLSMYFIFVGIVAFGLAHCITMAIWGWYVFPRLAYIALSERDDSNLSEALP